MPCYDGRDNRNEVQIIYRDRDSPEIIKANKWLEAALCALITELEKRDISERFDWIG